MNKKIAKQKLRMVVEAGELVICLLERSMYFCEKTNQQGTKHNNALKPRVTKF